MKGEMPMNADRAGPHLAALIEDMEMQRPAKKIAARKGTSGLEPPDSDRVAAPDADAMELPPESSADAR